MGKRIIQAAKGMNGLRLRNYMRDFMKYPKVFRFEDERAT